MTTKAKVALIIDGKTLKAMLSLSPGKHKVVIKVGKESSKPLWFNYLGKPELYVFSVGVPNDLKYPCKDAQDIVTVFEKQLCMK